MGDIGLVFFLYFDFARAIPRYRVGIYSILTYLRYRSVPIFFFPKSLFYSISAGPVGRYLSNIGTGTVQIDEKLVLNCDF